MKLVAGILAVAGLVCCAQAAGPNLPQQWTATTTNHLAINQGGSQGADGMICCPMEAPECKVQTVFETGKQYFDFPNNRTALKSPDGSGTVTLFNLGKEFEVDSTGACQAWCPVQGPMMPFSAGANATNEGATTYNGVACNDWRSYEKILGIITMEQSDFYIKASTSGGYDTPIAQVEIIEPFGNPIGQTVQTFNDFTPGAPDASVFTVTGIDSCKKAQCGGDGDSSSSSPEEEVGERALAAMTAAERVAMAMESLERTTVPFGYSAPSALYPKPNFN